jgi:hypothetical protein
MKCKKCGAEVNGEFCGNCGTKVSKPKWKVPVIVIAAVGAIILVRACLQNIVIADLNKPEVSTAPPTTPIPLITPEPTESPDTNVFEISAFKVVYVSHEVLTNRDNEPMLLIKFEYTNKSKEPTAFGWAASVKAYQDGVEIESSPISWLKTKQPEECQNRWLEVQQGTTITAAETFKLRNMESPVDITVMEWPGIGSEKTELTLDIK